MKFSIIFVGDQKSKEQNQDFLLSEAEALGIEFENSFECEDVSSLQSSLSSALEKSEILFVAGGIGIGKDCFTVSTVSDFLNIPVALNENYVNIIQDKLKRSSYPISESISAAATLPTNCIVLPNDCAIAPGCLFLTSSQYIALLPSSPFELSTMFKRYALKPLIKFTDSPAAVQYVGCFDPDEQKLAAVCKEINVGFNVKTIICRNGPDVNIQLISPSGSDNINVAASELFSRLKPYSYSDNDLGLVNATVELMTDKYLSLSIAECGTRSYTTDVLTEHAAQKGAVAHSFRLSSDWNDLKSFGISPKLMKKYDIVSEQIAAEMSFIAKENGASQIGLSIVSSQTENSIAERSYLSLCDGEYIWTICVQNQIAPEIFAINLLRLYLSSLLPSGVPVQAALLGTSSLVDLSAPAAEAENPTSAVEKTKKSFLANILPWKGDKPLEMVRKTIFLIAVIVFILSGLYIINYYSKSNNNRNITNSLADLYGNDNKTSSQSSSPSQSSESSDENNPESSETEFPPARFSALYEINPDIVGMLQIPGTPLNHVVVQSYDNNYYLRRDFYGNKNDYGVLFADYEVDLKNGSKNILIYGHNMRDEQMFGEIVKYKKIKYYREHPVIYFDSIYSDGMTAYKIIACFLANTLDTDGPVFAYHTFIKGNGMITPQKYIDEALSRSYICTNVDVLPTDEFLTLSTCSYEFYEARWVVVARKVRPGESETVDTTLSYKNPNPVMPDTWIKYYLKNYASEISEGAISSEASSQISIPEQSYDPESSEDESSESSEPSEISELSEISESSEPSEISEPSEPSGISKPPEPSEISEPSESSETSESSEVSESSEPSEISEPSEPTETSEPSEPSEISEPFEPSEISEPSEPSEISEPSEPSEISEPSESSESSEPSEISEPSESSESSESSEISESSESSSSESIVDMSLEINQGSSSNTDIFNALANEVVYINGEEMTAFDAICQIVNAEVRYLHPEAIKAQAVATYTYLKYNKNSLDNVLRKKTVSPEIQSLVREVFGLTVNDTVSKKYVLAAYSSSCAGMTLSSESRWGGYVRNLLPVESPENVSRTTTFTSTNVQILLSQYFTDLTFDLTPGDEENWFRVKDYYDGCEGYYVKSLYVGSTLVSANKFRSAISSKYIVSTAFTITYNKADDTFTFVSRGKGHGVGLSQYGADEYAKQGKTYDWILLHYYSNSYIKSPYQNA